MSKKTRLRKANSRRSETIDFLWKQYDHLEKTRHHARQEYRRMLQEYTSLDLLCADLQRTVELKRQEYHRLIDQYYDAEKLLQSVST